MQNITSLLSSPAEGSAVNSVSGANNGTVSGFEDVSSDQKQSFLKALSNFIEDHSEPGSPAIDPSNTILVNPELQELPLFGNDLPMMELSELSISETEFSASELSALKAFLDDLVKDLTHFNNADIPDDQREISERLATQLAELARLIQDSSGEDIRIPSGLANDILNTVTVLKESVALTAQYHGPARQANPVPALPIANSSNQHAQATYDIDKSFVVLDEAKINQLSTIVQSLVVASADHARIRPEVGLSDLLKSSLTLSEAKGGDTLIGNAAGLSGQTSQLAADKAVPSLPITSSFNQSGWGNEVGERIRWMVSQNIQSAELRLNPAHLGPVEVRVTVHNDQMNVMFTAHHAAVRDALELALPRLREMFGDNGLNLANVDVSQHSFSDQRRATSDAGTSHLYSNSGEYNDDQSEIEALNQQISSPQGLIDYYA